MSLYDNDPAFAGIDAVPAPDGGDGDFGPDFKPMPGSYVVTISSTKFDRSKKGELYVKVEYKLDTGERWSVLKNVTDNGQPHEGRVKSTRILLRQHGLDGTLPAGQWSAALSTLVGRRAQVEVVVNGEYLNTEVRGVDAPRAPVAAPPADQSPVFAPPAQAPVPSPIQEHLEQQAATAGSGHPF